jgi:hypothetical protein
MLPLDNILGRSVDYRSVFIFKFRFHIIRSTSPILVYKSSVFP